MRESLLLLCLASGVSAQQLRVDTTQARRPIRPDIYGINEYGVTSTFAGQYPFTVRRWGGDNSVSYNWKLDSNNTAANWYFETFPIDAPNDNPVKPETLPDDSTFDRWVAMNKSSGFRSVATVPIIGWTTGTRQSKKCSYSVAKYGPQQATDVYAPDCGNGMTPDGKRTLQNDPNDVYARVEPDFAADWVTHVAQRFGTADQGGVWLWELDNEPTWWHAVHRDIHPLPATFDEMLDRNVRWASAIKASDPSAKVGGATPPGWESYFYSAKDLYAGWSTGPDYKYWNNPTDCKAHFDGGVCGGFIPWYLSKMRDQEASGGVRLMDYLEIHAYISPDNLPGNYQVNKSVNDALRLTSTRSFWDPSYMPPRDDMKGMNAKWGVGNPQLIPRMRKWIDDNYPGTLLAITEYNWGAPEHITGALAQADLLGIFGREGVDLATIWGPPGAKQPASFAWRMFLNYDGQGGAFGETSVLAKTANADEISIFAAERKDGAVTMLLLNKTPDDRMASLDATNAPAGSIEAWRYSRADLTRIVLVDGVTPDAMPLPGYSMTMLVLKPALSQGGFK